MVPDEDLWLGCEVESDVVGVETMAFSGTWRSPESRGKSSPLQRVGLWLLWRSWGGWAARWVQ